MIHRFYMQEALERFIHKKTIIPFRPFSLTKLSGQASYREYYRIEFGNKETLILMKMPPGYSSISEEITKTDRPIEELPFINVQSYLKKQGLPVPEIFGYAKDDGFLLLQDLGDSSLEEIIKVANIELTLFFYKKAIELLVSLQYKTSKKIDENCLAWHRRFDESLLNWEFDHFREYGLEDRLGICLNELDRRSFEEATHSITKKITQMPQGFVHRDFQSRNLYLYGYKFWMIDFQDALTGPVVYDLVSLLRDSYVVLQPEMVETLKRRYLEKIDKDHPYFRQPERLDQDFDLITIQRKLKDAGRFQYIHTVKKNSSFLKHVEPSLRYVREALERRKEFGGLTDLLKKYLPEMSNQ